MASRRSEDGSIARGNVHSDQGHRYAELLPPPQAPPLKYQQRREPKRKSEGPSPEKSLDTGSRDRLDHEDDSGTSDGGGDLGYSGHDYTPHGAQTRKPLRMIDWRGELCRLLSLDSAMPDATIFEEMEKTEAILEDAQRLKGDTAKSANNLPRYQVLYRIQCSASQSRETLHLREPWIVDSGPLENHLQAGPPVRNFELHLEREKGLSFIVYKDFVCCQETPINRGLIRYDDESNEISQNFVGEMISIISENFSLSMKKLERLALEGIAHPKFDIGRHEVLTYPYLWWYHARSQISEAGNSLDEWSRQNIEVLRDYLELRLGSQWEVVDELLYRGMITRQLIEYAFVPDEILISKQNGPSDARLQGLLSNGWLRVETACDAEDPPVASDSRRYYPGQAPDHSYDKPRSDVAKSKVDGTTFTIACTYWQYDGNFQQEKDSFRISGVPKVGEFPLRDLELCPARFADKALVASLRSRGAMFWDCRARKYVCYDVVASEAFQQTSNPRFMVDILVYKQMHSPTREHKGLRDDLGPARTGEGQPPPREDDFLMCLPATIVGFDMEKKEWVNLEVSNLKEVEWNKKAFDMLVADQETKDLVRALVDSYCASEKNRDLISGKGDGMFFLLHGVAEMAEKPLYRVTCGHMGTRADDVERYLELVLHLGKKWGCVVLLDEADVYLEERSLYDLKRNALVSVFLRILEYYDGILILTSNRVGTFDEAVQSRMQLTLRYTTLGAEQRATIWENFIVRLERFDQARGKALAPTKEPGVDVEDLKAHVGRLAQVKLNGRQIRNAVATARQLAAFQNENMQYRHLQTVIKESEKFDAYLKEVASGFSADAIQRDRRVR